MLLQVWLPAICLTAFSAAAQTITISSQKDTSAGMNGRLNMFMSTSFQPADWDYQFFTDHPQAPKLLWQLAPQHINVQALTRALAQTGPHTWDFSENDAILQPLLAVSDHSPLYQVATAPDFLKSSDGFLHPANFPAFAQYSSSLVRYFNSGGFDDGGKHFQSPSPWPIMWWGIYNEPNINGISAQDYVSLYNMTVPLMQSADQRIKFVAVELSDFGDEPQRYLPTFVQNVKARVDAVATHYYGSCNQRDTDQQVLDAIGSFTSHVQFIYSQMATNPALAGKPVWVTENNVNADFEGANGMSTCNQGQPFVADARGTSAFFAAWRPLVFLSLAKAGAQSLHHWDHDADLQYGEVDYDTGTPYLSYWVDYYLNHLFPFPPGADILRTSTSDATKGVDAFAVRNDDGSVVVMVVNHAIRNPGSDNNGPGIARTTTIDISQLGSFTSATLVTINGATPPATGPVPSTIAPAKTVSVSLNGYGVAFLRLNKTEMRAPAVANAASFKANSMAAGDIVSIFGTGLGPVGGAGLQTSTPGFVDNFVAGTRVYFDEFPAPLLYTSAGQVNAVVPWGILGRSRVLVRAEYLGQMSDVLTELTTTRDPAIFTLNTSGSGQGAILNADDLSVNSAANPVARGHYLAIYGTCGGPGTDAVDGRIETAASKPNLPITVTIGNQTTAASYAGTAPGFVSGAAQINVLVPQSVTPGPAVPISISIGGVTSPDGVTVAVK